ncbi:MAG: hypothetical protein KGJ61_06280 [Candidatus Omnitrophica bacterium]|nr:hypothetical protein [Candidatus Omnitrophota bacterium]
MFIEKSFKFLQAGRQPKDIFILFLLVLLLLLNSSYLHQELNLFEWGLYLPGIDAVLHGQVPFRDFFHLRGPFELYLPALFMKIFGFRADILAAYFYAGTVLTILVAVLIAYELIRQRALFYFLGLILVTHTFPRSVFTFWGGMRYAWGLLAVWCLVRFCKTKGPGWLMAAGCLAAISWFTSIEIGVISVGAFIAVMIFGPEYRRRAWGFITGFLAVSVPYGIYLLGQNAFVPYVHAQWVVVTQMSKTFLQVPPVPETVPEFLHAMFCPWDPSFYRVTPIYCFVFFFLFYFWRIVDKKATVLDHSALAVAVYGLVLFLTGFRLLGGPVFEMSLQPEKIVLFYLLEQLIVITEAKLIKFRWVAFALLAAVIISSAIYFGGRIKTRYWEISGVLHFLVAQDKGKPELVNGWPASRIDLPRIRHMTVPDWQAQDLEQLKVFIDSHVPAHETVWMYPELGSLNFILNRPWVGRFPVATLAWMDDGWFSEYETQLERHPPRYAIVNKVKPDCFDKVYFLVPANRVKYDQTMRFLHEHYAVEAQTPSYFIYRRIR